MRVIKCFRVSYKNARLYCHYAREKENLQNDVLDLLIREALSTIASEDTNGNPQVLDQFNAIDELNDGNKRILPKNEWHEGVVVIINDDGPITVFQKAMSIETQTITLKCVSSRSKVTMPLINFNKVFNEELRNHFSTIEEFNPDES